MSPSFGPYLLSVLFAAGVAGAIPVVFGVKVIAALFGSVLVPVRPKAAIPRTTTTVSAPSIHVVGLMMRSRLTGVGGIGRLFGLELSYVIGKLPYDHQRGSVPLVPGMLSIRAKPRPWSKRHSPAPPPT